MSDFYLYFHKLTAKNAEVVAEKEHELRTEKMHRRKIGVMVLEMSTNITRFLRFPASLTAIALATAGGGVSAYGMILQTTVHGLQSILLP